MNDRVAGKQRYTYQGVRYSITTRPDNTFMLGAEGSPEIAALEGSTYQDKRTAIELALFAIHNFKTEAKS